MKTRYGLSPWVELARRRPDFPRLKAEHAADVAIVGGGLAGCATAYACAAAGLTTIVVEAARIGQGSAARSAGLLLPDPGPGFRDIAQAHGLRAARRVFEAWRRASLDAAAQLRRLRIPCALDAIDSLYLAFRDEDKVLRREFDARSTAGLDARWVMQKQVRAATASEASAGLRLGDAFVLDPYRAAIGLAGAAAKRGVRFFERSAVKQVRAGRTGAELLVDGGVIRASTAIVTTGTATAEFKPLRRHFAAREGYLVLTEPVPAAIRRQMGWRDATLADVRDPRHRLRWTADDRILVGGADQDATPARTRPQVLVQRTGQLMYELLTMYPVIAGLRPEFGWELPYGRTADGLMYIGAHRNYPHHLFALGGSGDSVTGAFLAARILARAARGESAKADEVFGWTR